MRPVVAPLLRASAGWSVTCVVKGGGKKEESGGGVKGLLPEENCMNNNIDLKKSINTLQLVR